MDLTLRQGEPFLPAIRQAGLEPDQRIVEAVRTVPGGLVQDGTLFLALCRLNTISSRYLQRLNDDAAVPPWSTITGPHWQTSDPELVPTGQISQEDSILGAVMERAITYARPGHTLGVHHFLRSVLELGLERGDDFERRPLTIDLLTKAYVGNHKAPLSTVPDAIRLLNALRNSPDGSEDFQWVLRHDGDQVSFQVVSVLDDVVQRTDSGRLLAQRAILTHFRETFGGFSLEEIVELEGLINSPLAHERDFQRFFERHPHFLRRWDRREVFSQVTLAAPTGRLVPDFILVDRELQSATVLDVKLPTAKLIRSQHNRERFSAAVLEARAQLLRYRDWFRDSENREALKRKLGMSIYEPSLTVVIGRAREFTDEIQRQQLAADTPDVDVVTYDDIVALARRRRIAVGS